MKRYALGFVLLLMVITSWAQKLSVESMILSDNDLSASQYRRNDLNGQPCALVKVLLATTGATFEGNYIPPVEYKSGEYWVYMSEGSRELRIKHPSFVPLHVNFSDYGIKGIQSLATYDLTLIMSQMTGMDIDDGMRYLAMTVEPSNATVYIDNNLQTLENGILSLLLPMGKHQYRVEAQAYEPKIGVFTIDNETLQLSVKLESAMAFLSISTTTQGTQVYVNDQLRGTSSWSGSLPAGTYRVEGRLDGYRKYRQSITLAQRDNQQLTIPALHAITGVLNVNYQPLNAEVWMDDKKLGTSPGVFRNIAVGSHNIELRADGYNSKQEHITIEEGKTTSLTGALEKKALPASQFLTPQSSSNSGSAIETFTVNGVSFNMIRVEGGTFMMGCDDSEAEENEKPVHQVTLSCYSIGETEVTQELWQTVMGSNPSNFKGAKRPIQSVSWEDCQEFICKLNMLTGKYFRLPTEAEWEYAARGGVKSHGYKYSGSDNIDDVAWYDGNIGNKTPIVKTKQANELGLCDMTGNVWEWCQDWYKKYSRIPKKDSKGPSSGTHRVIRGGSWSNSARFCRVSYRDNIDPMSRNDILGLRLAL